ncbi:MAG TPA: hypothetical protein VNO19_15120 [Gemmatimonadales bacterium]|nr:hypothetical protein [Gemmatimonadales bacterium]
MTSSRAKSQPWALVLAGGFVAGTLDIAYACLFWAVKSDVTAMRIFQSVAAGLLGPVSFEGGGATAALGLALHYLIALSMSLVYYLAAQRWSLLWQRPVLCGAVYGLLMYAIMHYVVVPLSRAGPGSEDPLWISLTVGAHVLLIGIPIALFTRRARQP